jgi:hypothetical protein
VKTIISQAMHNKKAIALFEQMFEDSMCQLEATLRATNTKRSERSGGHELACIGSDSNSKSTKRNRAGYEMRSSQFSKVCVQLPLMIRASIMTECRDCVVC